MSACPQCGTASVRDGQRFCAQCGADLAGPPEPETVAVEPPPAYGQPPRVTGPLFGDGGPPGPQPGRVAPPPPPPAPPQQYVPVPSDGGRPGRRRTPVVVLAVAALVAALVGAAGVVLLLGDRDDDQASDTTAEDRRADDEATTDAGTSPADSPSDPATESASVTEEPRTFACWDGGAPVERPSDCDPPSGAEGMAWVFPSSGSPGCFTVPGENRATETDCTATVAGEAVRVHYSEWRNRANLESYYTGLAVDEIDPPGRRDDLTALQVVSRDSDVGYKVAIYYSSAEGLWSVTVYAADEEQYLAALQQLDIRPFAQLRGRRG